MPTQPLSLRILTVADPCTVPWSEMKGDARTRFCGQCRKNVHNIEELSESEADDILSRSETPCVRFRRRSDGTVVTRDCSRARRFFGNVARVAAASFSLLFVGSFPIPTRTMGVRARPSPALSPTAPTPSPPTTQG